MEDNRKESFSILIKATHACNLNCEYCYDKINQAKHGKTIMSKEHLEKIFDMVSKEYKDVKLIWHGGEPTCADIDFYDKAQDIIYKKYNTNFEQQMQTNGTNVDQDWIKFAKNSGIKLGFSYDGKDSVRSGSDKYTVKDNICRYNNETDSGSTISVISEHNIDHMKELFDELVEAGIKGIAFNHIYHADKIEEKNLFTEQKKLYEKYLDFYKYVIHQPEVLETNTAEMTWGVLGRDSSICNHSDCRYNWLSFSPDGSIYPCDAYYPDRYLCGNIEDYDNIADIFKSKGYVLYVADVEEKYTNYCYPCNYFLHCRGGCNGISASKFGTVAKLDEVHCYYFKAFYNAAYSAVKSIDVYNDTINPQFLSFIINYDAYLPIEIRDSIKRTMGLTYKDYSEAEIFELQDKLFDTAEHKILRLLNPYFANTERQITQVYFLENTFKIKDNLSVVRTKREEFLDNLIFSLSNKIYDIITSEE